MKCKKCKTKMSKGKALQNTPSMGAADFRGNTINSRGQTISMNGPAILISVDKCHSCGYSHT